MINPILVTVVCFIAFAGLVFRGHRYRMLSKRISKLYERGQCQDAIAVCDLILKWTPYSTHILYMKGVMLSEIGRDEEAIANHNLALKYEKFVGGLSIYGVWIARGDALLHLGRNEESVENYDKALKYQKGNANDRQENTSIWVKRGVALFNLDLYTQALNSFENALNYSPGDLDCLTRRGNVLIQLQRYEEALNSFDLALDRHPEFAPAFYDKACCYALQGNIDRSIENLVRALCLSPEDVRKHAKTDTDLDSIRSDNRFKELVYG